MTVGVPKNGRRNLLLAGAAAAVCVVAGSVAVAATRDSGEDEPKRKIMSSASPEQQAPASYVQQGQTSFSLSDLPQTYGPFVILPPGSRVERKPHYGDDRDQWKYTAKTAANFNELPQDGIVREPTVPTGYSLVSIDFTQGSSPDGKSRQMSEVHLKYSDGIHADILVSIFRPTEFSQGAPFPVVASTPDNPLVLDVGQIEGRIAVFQFMKPEHSGQGLEEVMVADEDLLIVVTSNRGPGFEDLVDVAASVLS